MPLSSWLKRGAIPLILCLSACSLSGTATVSLPMDSAARGYVLLQRPMVLPQGKVVYDCGPEALTCVLTYWGLNTSVEEATRVLYNPRLKGTLSTDLAPYARSKGCSTRYDNGSLGKIREAIQKQIPPIIMMDASGMFPMVTGRFYHFFVVSGYNDQEQVILCENYDASRKYVISYGEVERRWAATQYFYLEIVPASAYETYRTAQELEAHGEYAQAQALYEQALERDPDFQPAHLGLGNIYFLTGDLPRALTSYKEAYRLDPYDPVAMNNFAHVSMELGENLPEAETLIRKALEWYRSRLKTLASKIEEAADDPARQEIRNEWGQIRLQYALAHGTLGQIEYARKKWMDATATWELALTVTPESETEVRARRHYELGKAYREQGMQDQAKEHFTRAMGLSNDPELQSAIQKALSE